MSGTIQQITAINANLGPAFRANDFTKYRYTEFDGPVDGSVFAAVAGAPDLVALSGAPGVAVGDINSLFAGGYSWQYYVNGAFAGQVPQVVNNQDGLLLSLDAADNDGVELAPLLAQAITSVAGVHDGTMAIPSRAIDTFLAGTEDMFVRIKFKTEDVSAQDFVSVGFRLAQIPQTTLAGYTDYYVLNLNNGTTETRSKLNNGTESVSVSTEAVLDAGTVTYEVRINKAREAKALVNGAVVAAGQSGFIFDSTDKLIPFLLVQNDGADAGAIAVQLWESGTWDQRNITSLTDITN